MACGACVVYDFLGHLVAYFAILAALVIISCIILKCLGEWRDGDDARGQSESSPLMPVYYVSKTTTADYGAFYHRDIEQGNTSSSCSTSGTKYSDELYDTKICVICYDSQRNCFFVPCGHCATCHPCALRIFKEENRRCPVCRRFIGKVRKIVNS